jgi:hypothetical protein
MIWSFQLRNKPQRSIVTALGSFDSTHIYAAHLRAHAVVAAAIVLEEDI